MRSTGDLMRSSKSKTGRLVRKLTLWAVIAAALCNVIGGGINVLIVDIQNDIPGIGELVPWAILVGGIIALVLSLVYSSLSTAMPRAGGEYIYISRSLSPFLAFVEGVLKWTGSVIAMGTVAYMDVIILRTALHYVGWTAGEMFLSSTIGMIIGSLSLIWIFWLINYFGVRAYGKTVVVLASLMILGGLIIVYTGLTHDHQDFERVIGKEIINPPQTVSLGKFMLAVSMLFWAYIGFTSIAQAGGEIEKPKVNLPRAFIISSILITLYYFLYSYAFYHAVPWGYLVGLENANVPQLIGLFYPPEFAVLITFFIFIALANDIPPMLYTKSRLVYSWARDGILPKVFERTNRYGTPVVSLTAVALVGSLIAVSCVFGGFFTEVNVVVLSRFVIYMLIAVSLITLKHKNPKIYRQITFLKNRTLQIIVSLVVILISLGLMGVVVYYDLTSGKPLWKMATVQTLVIGVLGVFVYVWYVHKMKRQGKDPYKVFESLPAE